MRCFSRILPLLAALGLLAGCGNEGQSPSAVAGDANTLVLAAGSEVKDLEPLLERMRQETGVTLALRYTGTLDGIERVAGGEAYDGAWFSHAKYLMLVPEAAAKVRASERIMLSPVVLGVKQGVAKANGWGHQTTWAAVADRAGQGRFRFAMTNPTSSNSGFSALVGVAASLAGKADALEEADIQRERMARLFKGQTLTAGSSGWLADRYLEEQDHLDGLINYESVLLSLNRSGRLKEPLTVIHPQDGVITADYPLILLNEAKRPAYDKAVAWLKGDAAQHWIMANTLRRPAVPAVPVDRSLFGDTLLVDMPFPGKLSVVNALLLSYLGEQRRPASMYFVLDLSGSMSGSRLEDLRRALLVLAGQEGQGLASTFARFQRREQVTLIPFSGEVHRQDILRAEVGLGQPGAALEQVARFARQMKADGGTAMYDGLRAAYTQAAADMAKAPDRYYTVVVMTDGKTNEGASFADFQAWLGRQPAGVQRIRAFTVLFGDGNEQELQTVAQATGGRYFDSRRSSLPSIFKEIRGYQ